MDVIRQIITAMRVTRDGNAHTASVSGPIGGNPLGEPPAQAAYIGGSGWMHGAGPRVDSPDGGSSLQTILPAHRPPDSIQAEGSINRPFTFTRTNDDLWWNGPRGQGTPDVLWHHHRRQALNGWASRMAYGSSDVASGPEGTLILFPPRLPRPGTKPQSIAGAEAANVLLNYATSHTETPNVPVAT